MMGTLQGVLAASRFMHYILMQCCSVDTDTSRADLENRLNGWLRRYVGKSADSALLSEGAVEIEESSEQTGLWHLVVRLEPIVSGYRLARALQFTAMVPASRRMAEPSLLSRAYAGPTSTLVYSFTLDLSLSELLKSINAQGPRQWALGDSHQYGDYLGTTATPYKGVLRIYREGDRFLLVLWRAPLSPPEERDELLAVLRWEFLPSIGARDIALLDEPFD